MLQFAPITAPGSTWANAQIRVPSPIEWLSTSAVSCLKYLAASTGLCTASSPAECHTGSVIHNSAGGIGGRAGRKTLLIGNRCADPKQAEERAGVNRATGRQGRSEGCRSYRGGELQEASARGRRG